MEIPSQAPVMTLNNGTLFPQALLPLYIFEPRYREMLADALRQQRMFSVAMQQSESQNESPRPVAGLGLIRVSVDHEDGTSHLVLQGLTRVRLLDPVQLEPYRIHAIEPLPTPASNKATVDKLVAELHELVRQRFHQGALPFPLPLDEESLSAKTIISDSSKSKIPLREVINYLERLSKPEELADLVACALLPDPGQRQAILESVELENRLQKLIDFLMEEIRQHHKNHPS